MGWVCTTVRGHLVIVGYVCSKCGVRAEPSVYDNGPGADTSYTLCPDHVVPKVDGAPSTAEKGTS